MQSLVFNVQRLYKKKNWSTITHCIIQDTNSSESHHPFLKSIPQYMIYNGSGRGLALLGPENLLEKFDTDQIRIFSTAENAGSTFRLLWIKCSFHSASKRSQSSV